MKTVHQLLAKKGHSVWSIGADATVRDAIAVMARKDVGALVVLEGERLVGLIAERHYARRVVLKGKTSAATLVRDIMDTSVVTVRPFESVEACMALMTETRVRHLPVLDDGRLVGIISIGDLVQSIIGDQKITIKQLEQYIQGNGASL